MAKIDTFVASDNYFSQIPHWVLYSEISPQAIRLYAILYHYANRESHVGWPSRESLAKDLQVKSARTVDSCIDELEVLGAVKVDKRFNDKGWQTSNYYTVITAFPIHRGAADCAPALQSIAHPPSKELRTKENHLTITIEQEPKDNSFEKFWICYPRKAGKGAARIAFLKALKKATYEEIFAGAQRLASDPNLDLQFCPHASTWLNQERWTDEPLPGAQSKITAKANRALAFAQELEKENRAAIGNF